MPTLRTQRLAARFALLCAVAPLAHAAATDVASAPLITSAPQAVLPNLMFVLDDSGSMAFTHLPDDAADFTAVGVNCNGGTCQAGTSKYGYRSSQCNGVYYNPAITYTPPVTSTGASYPNATFTAAWNNGYNTAAGTTNLSTSFTSYIPFTSNQGFSTTETPQAAYYYRYTGTQTNDAQKLYFDTNSTFYQECASNVGSAPGNAVFTLVTVGAAEQQNFANWYSYYRSRMQLMKTSAGRAFNSIGDQYRVGYMSINNAVSPSYLDFATFNATQKASWYTKLYTANPSGSTPLRGALSTVGRVYGRAVTTVYGQTVADPVQYSCQRNFTLLSTDGYWNESATPTQLNGTTQIGQQDGDLPRPYNDGTTTTTIYTSTLTVSGSGNTAVTSVTVNGAQILSASTSSNNTLNVVATRITNNINACTAAITGNCTVAGYSAVRSGSTITITAPTTASATPVVVRTGSMTISPTAFVAGQLNTNGPLNTLADVASYYYRTDLRTDIANDVVPSGEDSATWQHMTTFTLGLGARGRMLFTPNYKSATSGDYYSVATGATASSTVCTWQTPGTVCNWPTPANNSIENIDDLWHAAVNGRGTYFSATDPASLSVGLNSALQAINAITSDAAAAATSNPNITAGDNYIFISTFRSGDWYGDLERRQINLTTGEDSATADWTARGQLDANTSRTIYTYDPNATTRLKLFTWANLTSTEQSYFTTPYISTNASPVLSQFCVSGDICLSSTSQAAASGQPLVDFIRGDRTNEGAANQTDRYFRLRTSLLGDIVNSEAVYVKAPLYSYADTGYSAYKTANQNRQSMVYVGANDGMLHAFNGETGAEAWAYIPSTVIPNLYKLADKYYSTHHQYYVDGSPTQGDVYFGGAWHTILVGGLNSGGRGYYALDVTNPTSPRALWEFTSANSGNLGYSFGRPEITKLRDGTWVVLVTSGYNNVSNGDGQGYLYVINAGTGQLIRAIGTGVGSTNAIAGVCATAPCPSGLAQIRAWVDNTEFDNTTARVYGGDLFGNVWRFDVNNDVGASGYDAQLLATLRNPSGGIQPVTTRPELGRVGTYPVVFVGTGRYLGVSDLTDTSQQSMYAIKDSLTATGFGNPRTQGTFVQQSFTTGTCGANSTFCNSGDVIRTVTSNTVNFATNGGWYIDLPASRERANTDPQLALGSLAFTTNVLDPSACSVGGSSYLNVLDYRTGGAVSTANGIGSFFLGNVLATRPALVKLPDGSVRAETRTSDNQTQNNQVPVSPTGGSTRRTSWRELVTE